MKMVLSKNNVIKVKNPLNIHQEDFLYVEKIISIFPNSLHKSGLPLPKIYYNIFSFIKIIK